MNPTYIDLHVTGSDLVIPITWPAGCRVPCIDEAIHVQRHGIFKVWSVEWYAQYGGDESVSAELQVVRL